MQESKDDLRRRAALARWAARFRTKGGHEADDHLRALADKLDRDAEERDRGAGSPARKSADYS